eukprot:PhF_6_TR10859/c0_g1_i1/m.17589
MAPKLSRVLDFLVCFTLVCGICVTYNNRSMMYQAKKVAKEESLSAFEEEGVSTSTLSKINVISHMRSEDCSTDFPEFYVVTVPSPFGPSNHVCAQLQRRSGNCMEETLHRAFKRHPCRLKTVNGSAAFWVESYFANAYVRRKIVGYKQHLLDIAREVKKLGSSRQVFLYIGNWELPSLIRLYWNSTVPEVEELRKRTHLVTHSVGDWVMSEHNCLDECEYSASSFPKALRKDHMLRCQAIMCQQKMSLDISVNDREPLAHHIAIPHAEPNCRIRPSQDIRTIFIYMSGSDRGEGRRVIHDQLKKNDESVWDTNTDHSLQSMCRANFCVETQGSSLNTRRLTDAVLCGCIPVLICDVCTYPFENSLTYSKFSVRIPDKDATRVVQILKAIPKEQVEAMRTELKAVRPYFITPLLKCGESSMVDGILREMKHR